MKPFFHGLPVSQRLFHKNYMTLSFHVSTIYNRWLLFWRVSATVMRGGEFKGDQMKFSVDT